MHSTCTVQALLQLLFAYHWHSMEKFLLSISVLPATVQRGCVFLDELHKILMEWHAMKPFGSLERKPLAWVAWSPRFLCCMSPATSPCSCSTQHRLARLCPPCFLVTAKPAVRMITQDTIELFGLRHVRAKLVLARVWIASTCVRSLSIKSAMQFWMKLGFVEDKHQQGQRQAQNVRRGSFVHCNVLTNNYRPKIGFLPSDSDTTENRKEKEGNKPVDLTS